MMVSLKAKLSGSIETKNGTIGAGVNVTKERAAIKKVLLDFFKKSREWRGQSPFPGAHFPYFRS